MASRVLPSCTGSKRWMILKCTRTYTLTYIRDTYTYCILQGTYNTVHLYVYTHCTLQGAAILQAVDDSEIHAYIHIYIEAHWESTGHLLIPLVLPLPRVLDIAWCVGTSLQILQRGLLLATLQVCSLVGSLQSGLLLAMLPVCSLFGSLGRIVEESSVGLISQVVPNLYFAAPLA